MRKFLLFSCFLFICSCTAVALAAPVSSDDDDDAAPTKGSMPAKPAADEKPTTAMSADAKQMPAAKPAATAKSAATAKPAANAKTPTVKAPVKKSASSKGSLKLSTIGHALKAGSGRAAAVAAGFAIGTPVAALRLIARADKEQSEAVPLIGESKNKALQAVAHVVVIPSAVFSGSVQAPVYSAINAWKQSDSNPFGPESFFFGDLDSRVPQ